MKGLRAVYNKMIKDDRGHLNGGRCSTEKRTFTRIQRKHGHG